MKLQKRGQGREGTSLKQIQVLSLLCYFQAEKTEREGENQKDEKEEEN